MHAILTLPKKVQPGGRALLPPIEPRPQQELSPAQLPLVNHRVHHSDPMRRLGERVVVLGECWIVNGEPYKYASVYVHTAYEAAHRYVYAQTNDAILDSTVHIHHTCEHPGCINPAHLMAVTPGDHSRIHHGTLDPADADTPEAQPLGLPRPRWTADGLAVSDE